MIIKNWWVFALIAILLFSFWIRTLNVVPDRILSFDPTFQYRFTKYVADWGHLPEWDELTYYVGRQSGQLEISPFMLYITAFIFFLLNPLGFSLLTVCSYSAAFYGALIAIPAFLLGRELSNKYGGLLAAALITTAPQILVRTFGSSYDTDQLTVLFIILTLYLGLYALRKKTVASFCMLALGSLAFMLAWGMFAYPLAIIFIFTLVYLALLTIIGAEEWAEQKDKTIIKPSTKHKFNLAFKGFKKSFTILALLGIFLIITGFLFEIDVISNALGIVSFAQSAEAWIVNISIAELQPFNVFNLDGWMLATGRFMSGYTSIDNLFFILMSALMMFAFYASFKKSKRNFAFLVTLFFVAIYTTFRGIRFTEFTSGMFIIIVAAGFGYLYDYFKDKIYLKNLVIGIGIFMLFFSLNLGYTLGNQLGPDMNQNWDDTWEWIKLNTPQDALVGTWWDPGHMIAANAERRNFADGAHCPEYCMYNINDRITDLGKIMVTTNEEESIELIQKYKGTSSKVYWIASDDLIGKFQWLQYFGTGCDARVNPNCPLYYMVGRSDVKYDAFGDLETLEYQNVKLVNDDGMLYPFFVEGKKALKIRELIYTSPSGNQEKINFEDSEVLTSAMNGKAQQVGLTLEDGFAPITVTISQDYSTIILIPQHLREAVFTKMFFLNGDGLEHFNMVYSNAQVKIFEVV